MSELQHVKSGCLFTPCTPDLVEGIITATLIYKQYHADIVITSGSDGVHPAGGNTDPHYLGYAFDARISNLNEQILPLLVVDLRQALGLGWTVVVEPTHIHCQCNKFRHAR